MSAHENVHLTDAQVNEYVDRVMDEAARLEAERHLASCTSCRDTVVETRALVTTAQRWRSCLELTCAASWRPAIETIPVGGWRVASATSKHSKRNSKIRR